MAIDFGVHERTLRRWIARPGLRPVLRAVRHGKQWRLDIPKTALGFALYKRDVLRVVRPFRRKRRKRISRLLKKKIARAFGYDEEHKILRERGLRILRQAIDLRLANTKATRAFKTHSEIRSAATNCRGTVRIIAAKLGLYGNNIFKVRRYLDHADAEQHEILKFWPTRAQWEEAGDKLERLWRKRTIVEAAYEIAKENKPITGKNLAPLLFLNEGREQIWKQREKLKQVRDAYLPPDIYSYGRRGISLRLFRERYERADIIEARTKAEGTVQSEQGTKPKTRKTAYQEGLYRDDKTPETLSGADLRWKKKIEAEMRATKSEAERKRLANYLQELKS